MANKLLSKLHLENEKTHHQQNSHGIIGENMSIAKQISYQGADGHC